MMKQLTIDKLPPREAVKLNSTSGDPVICKVNLQLIKVFYFNKTDQMVLYAVVEGRKNEREPLT